MDHLDRIAEAARQQVTRRWFFKDCGVGLASGALALEPMGGRAEAADLGRHRRGRPIRCRPRLPHFAPKAKRVIYLFHGRRPEPPGAVRQQARSWPSSRRQAPAVGVAGGLPRGVHQPELDAARAEVQVRPPRQERGQEISELLPHLAADRADDIAIVKSMHTDAVQPRAGADPHEHRLGPAIRPAEHGRPGPPTAWAASRSDLPAYVVFNTGRQGDQRRRSPTGAAGSCRRCTRGSRSAARRRPGPVPVQPRRASTAKVQRDSLDAIRALNRQKHLGVVGDPEIATRINSFEMAYRMQASAPELMDLSGETRETLDLYGAEPGKASFAGSLPAGPPPSGARRRGSSRSSTKPGTTTAAWSTA